MCCLLDLSPRLLKALARSQAQFNKDYNDRLYTGLLFLSLGLAVFFRFALHVRVLEAVCWASFVFLELYPHLNLGPRGMYDTQWWHGTVRPKPWCALSCLCHAAPALGPAQKVCLRPSLRSCARAMRCGPHDPPFRLTTGKVAMHSRLFSTLPASPAHPARRPTPPHRCRRCTCGSC